MGIEQIHSKVVLVKKRCVFFEDVQKPWPDKITNTDRLTKAIVEINLLKCIRKWQLSFTWHITRREEFENIITPGKCKCEVGHGNIKRKRSWTIQGDGTIKSHQLS